MIPTLTQPGAHLLDEPLTIYQADHKDSTTSATRAAQPPRQPVPHHGAAVLPDGPARLPAGHHSHAEKPLHDTAECGQVGD